MISVAVRVSVRVCQQVTSCEFSCKSSNTDGAKVQTFQGFNKTTLAYNPSIFTIKIIFWENVGSGWLFSLIRLVVMLVVSIRVRKGQRDNNLLGEHWVRLAFLID